MRDARPPRRGQRWPTFLQVTDLLFRPLFAFSVIELGSRRVVHVGVTRHPSDAWVAQQLREATPCAERPTYLIHDNDSTDGRAFTRVAETRGIAVLRTAYRTPTEHAACERFLGSVRRECLDHVLVLSAAQLRRILWEYVAYCNTARPHQGLQQRIPDGAVGRSLRSAAGGTVRAVPVLGGLQHAYSRAA